MDILTRMMAELPFGSGELLSLIASAPRRYKVYQIPKRTPGKFRTIAHPSRELKFVQRWLIRRVLTGLPVHPAATAYRTGTSILDNAQRHVAQQYLLKMDIKDFFPSIKPRDFLKHCEQYLPNLSQSDQRALTQILFRRNKETDLLELAIGAPSSPLISNSVFYPLDEEIAAYCNEHAIAYTRYADDLTFSTNHPHILTKIPTFVAEVLAKATYPNLTVNLEKTVHSSKKHHRQVTGLVLTSDQKVSIGREKKRILKALIHRYTLGQLSIEDISNLRGQLSFVHSVEPTFLTTLENKYGVAKMSALISYASR